MRWERSIMSYEEFVAWIEKELKRNLGQDRQICVRTVVKNNGRKRRGLVFSEPGVNISPTIYLEEYYEQYRQGMPQTVIAEQIAALYAKVKVEECWEESSISTYDSVRDRIVYRLVNREKNQEMLREMPYVEYLNLAIVFSVILEMGGEEKAASMLIKNEHLDWWEVTKEEVYEAACRNTERLFPCELSPMWAVLQAMQAETPAEADGEDMLILTNARKSFGASALLYKGMLKKIGDSLGEDFYVLPSSVHEVIVLPEGMAPEWEELNGMVREINETQVEEEEVLSDDAYFYERAQERLRMM